MITASSIRNSILSVLFLVATCRAGGPGADAGAQTPGRGAVAATRGHEISGTYEIRICHITGCGAGDTTAVGLLGLLVLDTANIRVDFRNQEERNAFLLAGFGYGDEPEQSGNLCYSLREGPAISTGLAGVPENGRAVWRPLDLGPAGDSGMFVMTLYATADAGYDVLGTVRNGRLEGTGTSSGVGVATQRIRERVVGMRIGPPRPQLCVDSMRAYIRDEPQRERVHRARMALPRTGPQVLAAFSRSLRDFGFTITDSSASAGRVRTAPRVSVTTPSDGAAPRRTWSFPDSVSLELTTRTMPGDSSVSVVLVFAPVRRGVQPTKEIMDQRYEVGFAIWGRMKQALGLPPTRPPD